MKEIPLTQGKVALVDDEDFEAVSAFKWGASRHGSTFYAQRNIPRPGGGWTSERLHRYVLTRVLGCAIPNGKHCDHKNGDGLDNRRENLRVVEAAENGRNRRGPNCNNRSSRFTGVTLEKRSGKWVAQIQVNRKHIHIGRRATKLAAAQVREAYIDAHPELCARTNFPITGEANMRKPKEKKPLHRGQDDRMREQGFLPVSAVASQCGVTRATIDLWMRDGHVEFTRVGLRIYVKRASLESFLGPEGAKMLEAAT